MKKLPFNPQLSARQQLRFVTTDGTPTVLTLSFNERSEFWYTDIEKTLSDGTKQSYTGVKLVPNWPLLWEHKGVFPFPGDFLVLPTSAAASSQPIGYFDLGTNWVLCWLLDSEVDAWRSANGLQ